MNCQTDGQISGRGATFAARAQTSWIVGFHDDVCGSVSGGIGDNNMVIYNNPATNGGASDNGLTGSGAGRTGQDCRTDAYGGTDGPYNEAQWVDMNKAPGNPTDENPADCHRFNAGTYAPNYQPKPSPYPNASDQQARIMSFPWAGSAVAIAVNLTDADCGGTAGNAPTSLSLTGDEVSRLFGGDILRWNTDAQLVADNPLLANCDVPVTRVVRLDNSGTTQIFKNYLQRADTSRSNGTCDNGAGHEWSDYNSKNQQWPNLNDNTTLDVAATGSCSAISRGRSTTNVQGNLGVLDFCLGANGASNLPGAVCYADLPDTDQYSPPIIADVQNGALTGFASPFQGSSRANCNFGALSLPTGSFAGAVGLNGDGTAAVDNWATNNGSGNRGDLTFRGSSYPICGLTFGLVFSRWASAVGGAHTTAVAISRLLADQRRTLYSYVSYILSSAGQDKLTSNLYQSLSPGIVSTLRKGFQDNF